MSGESQQFRDMASQILSPIDSKGAALFRYAADAIDERDLLKSQSANSLVETQEQFKRTAHESSELDRLSADNTQLRKEVERLSQRNGVLEAAQTACLGERDTAIGELAQARADGAAMRGALEAVYKDYTKHNCTFVEKALSTNCGAGLLSRYREAVDLITNQDEIGSPEWCNRRDTLLATVKGGSI